MNFWNRAKCYLIARELQNETPDMTKFDVFGMGTSKEIKDERARKIRNKESFIVKFARENYNLVDEKNGDVFIFKIKRLGNIFAGELYEDNEAYPRVRVKAL